MVLIDDGTTGAPSPFHDDDEKNGIYDFAFSVEREESHSTATSSSDKFRNRQLAFLMNSVLRRSLSLHNSSVLQRQLWTSTAFHQIPPSCVCARTGWRQYSTHNPDGFKDKSAVGVSHLHILPLLLPC